VTPLRDIVAAETATAEELPLVHTTRCEILPYIVASHELRSLTECDVFHEHLLYFFYGRPAYRHKDGGKPSGKLDLCPVCFVFKPHTIGSAAKRVFACDSGGIEKSRFVPHLAPPDRDELQLETTLESARKLVALLFGDNGRYFSGKAQAAMPTAFAAGSPAARFHALLTDTGPIAGDDRRSAIEVQMGSPVALNHNLLCVVLPKEMMEQPGVRPTIQQVWQTETLHYETYPGVPPHEYTATIRDALRRRFQEGDRL
jgi:hypothetical protein